MFETHGRGAGPLVSERRFRIGISRIAVLLERAGRGREEALKAIRTDAEHRGGRTHGRGACIAGVDFIGLIAPLRAIGKRERIAAKRLDKIGAQFTFLLGQLAGTERRGRQIAKARVDRLFEPVVNFVARGASVKIPFEVAALTATHATNHLVILDIGAEQGAVPARKLAVDRIQKYEAAGARRIGRQIVRRIESLSDDAIHQRLRRRVRKEITVGIADQRGSAADAILRGQHGSAIEEAAQRGVVHIAAESIQLGIIGQMDAGIDEEFVCVDVGIAPTLTKTVVGHFVGTDDVGNRRRIRARSAPRGDVRGVTLSADMQESGGPERKPGVGIDSQPCAIALAVFTVLCADRGALSVVFEDDVDHAGNRIGAVQHRCAVAQYLDALDRIGGNGRKIDGLCTLVYRAQRVVLQIHQS